MTTEYIFPNKDNSFTLKYALASGLPTPTKIEFSLNGTAVDSLTNPEYFSSSLDIDGEIEFKLGDAGYVPADSGKCTVTIFDAVNTDGVVYTAPCGPTIVHIKVC